MRGIADWLASIGLEEYAVRFVEHGIDVSVVRDLTEQDLKDLGVSLGHRRKILRCASALAVTAADEPERRQLTVMFCDLVASATLSTRLDIEDFRDVILTNNVCVADLVREHNGKMACYMGDGTLAYFGHPEAGEDNADQAIHAALAIIENVARLKNDLGVELKVRIGIATGVVVVGDVMSDGVVRDRPLLGRRRISRHACSRLLSLTRC